MARQIFIVKAQIVDANGTFARAAVAMLIAVLFFGVAGQLFPNGKGEYLSLVIISLINVVVIAALAISDVEKNLVIECVLMAFAIVVSFLLLPQCTEKWVAFDRI